jgi:glycosyltransferase involved in cell wall biosynthesis
MSKTQIPCLLERGVPESALSVILHGVDTGYFRPGSVDAVPRRDGPLRALLVGATERDHAFAAAVLSRMPPDLVKLTVLTMGAHRRAYEGVASVELLPKQDDEAFLRMYQRSDLLFMPMLDCTANNVFLEAMACGTPVMTNRVGGVPEYISPACNIIMDDKNVDEWVEVLSSLARDRDRLAAMRQPVRQWAGRFDWKRMADDYRAVYARLIQA